MEKTESQGGRGTQKAKGKASQEKGNQVRFFITKFKCIAVIIKSINH